MKKERLDQLVFSSGLAPSREKARAMIMAGQVYVNGCKADKAGMAVAADAQLEVKGGGLEYVSRGGLKLEKALQVFGIGLDGKICVDIGASTGGFTDCMLQNKAAKVYAIDVGYGQLAWKLRCDGRVTVVERCNFRTIEDGIINDEIDFYGVDVSFISLKLILPQMRRFAARGCGAVCLIKPQFEAGRGMVGKNGVVRDRQTHIEVIHTCCGYAMENGFEVLGLDYSPIRGPKGNIEFLMHIALPYGADETQNTTPLPDVESLVNAAHGM